MSTSSRLRETARALRSALASQTTGDGRRGSCETVGMESVAECLDTLVREPLSWGATGFRKWWRSWAKWPPNVFAITSHLLRRSGAYIKVVSPDGGWPSPSFTDEVRLRRSREWRKLAAQAQEGPRSRRGGGLVRLPRWLFELGQAIQERARERLDEAVQKPDFIALLLEAHVTADETCEGVGFPLESSWCYLGRSKWKATTSSQRT